MTASAALPAAAQRLIDQISVGIDSGDVAVIRPALAGCTVAVLAREISASDGDAVVCAGRAGNKMIRAAAQRMRLDLRACTASGRQGTLEQAATITLTPAQLVRLDQTNLGTQLLAANVPPKSRKRAP